MDKTRLESAYLPAALQALAQFPLQAERVEPVSVSENVTFRVMVAGDGSDYVLRLHRPGYNSLAELNSERAWTRALKEDGFAVPGALRSRTGEHYAPVDIDGNGNGPACYAGVTTWTEGICLRHYLEDQHDPAERAPLFRQIGALIARLHNQATAWEAPPGFTRYRLDADGLLGKSPRWGRFWEHASLSDAERTLLLSARQALREALQRYGQHPGTFSLIHADIDPGNIIRNGIELALIDFDDAGYGWHGYDLASTLDEFFTASDRPTLQAALIEGYCAHRPLAEEDLTMLPLFMLIRGMAMIGWYHERPENSDPAYFGEVKAWVLEQCAAGPARPAPR